MFIPVIRVFVFCSLRCLVTISFLAVPWFAVSRCFGQEPPPKTEEQKQAREALNKGVEDFKNGQYDEAIAEFERAKQLDPQLVNSRLYLATAYASQYIPGATGEDNVGKERRAVEEFKGVLVLDPQNIPALDGMGSILYQMAGQPYDPNKFASLNLSS